MNDSRSRLDPQMFVGVHKRLLVGGGSGYPATGKRP